MIRFAPGNCCNTTTDQAVCIYTGKYSDAQLLALLDRDYRRDPSRQLPWYYPIDGQYQAIYNWPVVANPDGTIPPGPTGLPPCHILYSHTWTIPTIPTPRTDATVSLPEEGLNAASFFARFGGGLTPAIVAGGLGGSAWANTSITIGQTSPATTPGTELPNHVWYLQIILYKTTAEQLSMGPGAQVQSWTALGIKVSAELLVMPLDHATGTASAYYATIVQRARNAKYLSVAMVPWSREQQRVCLTDCGLYTCNCANSGQLRIPTTIRPYGTRIDSLDGDELADELGADEIYPSGNYYLTVSTNPVRPQYLDASIGGGLVATNDSWVFPTAEDLRSLSALQAYLQSFANPVEYCGLYKCGRALVVEGGQTAIIPEGAIIGYHQDTDGPNGTGGVTMDRSHYHVTYPFAIAQSTCPDMWPAPTNCHWGTTTSRRWTNCASCRVVECRCPTALANGVGSLGVGQTRVVPGADYIEVRSGSCNASACSNWRL